MKKKILRVLKSRAIIVWLLIAIQLFLVFWLAIAFTKYYYFYTVATFFVSFAFLLYLMKASRSMSRSAIAPIAAPVPARRWWYGRCSRESM